MENLIDFRMLQMQMESTVEEAREKMTELTSIICSLDKTDYYRQAFANLRELNVETLKAIDSFFIPDDLPLSVVPEEYRQEKFGLFNKYKSWAYQGRYMFPVKDPHGKVMGFVGYDKFEEPKYRDSKNFGYLAKQSTCMGMEKLPEIYRSNEPVFVVEGVICGLYLQQEGYLSLTLLGSSLNNYMVAILNRLRERVIVIPDTDEAGLRLAHQASKKLKYASIFRPCMEKDIDDTRRKYNNETKEELNNIASNKFVDLKLFKKEK